MKITSTGTPDCSSKITPLRNLTSRAFVFWLIFGLFSFPVFAGPSFSDVVGFDKSPNLANKVGFKTGNGGSHGGEFTCANPNCPERRTSGEHAYLVFNQNATSAPSCLESNTPAALQLGSPFTITAWVRLDGQPALNQMQIIASRWLTTHNNREWRFGIDNLGGTTRLIFEKSTNGKSSADAASLYYADTELNGKFIRRWIHVGFGMDPFGKVFFSINGVSTKAVQMYGPKSLGIAKTSAPARIGCIGGDSFDLGFHGMIDEVNVSTSFFTSKELRNSFAVKRRLYDTPVFVGMGMCLVITLAVAAPYS